MTDELDYSEVAEDAQKDALQLYDLLLRELCTGEFQVQGPDATANARVEELFEHMRNGTTPGPTQADRMRAHFAAKGRPTP